MKGSVVSLARYPVKGMSAEPLGEVSLVAGEGIPHDRVMAFRRPTAPFDDAAPEPLRKTHFYMLARDAALAKLKSRYDPDTDTLTVENGKAVNHFALSTPEGVAAAEAAVAEALDLSDAQRPKLTRSGCHRFTDVSVVSTQMMNAISLINAARVRAFAQKTDTVADHRRFRGNVVFDGWPAWSELQLEGSRLKLGGATLKVLLRTQRCAATAVNPDTAQRDVQVPQLLKRTMGHMDMGIYAGVIASGSVRPGDEISLIG
ncbi:MAG: MOSC domain-containing protein [Pseudomonadota bacterium]